MLYIMRHGITDWNRLHKLQGRTDIPLSDEGREMARRAREEYSGLHIDVCYCSPLSRARETAEILLENRNIPIITDNRLLEMCFGEYEGLADSFKIPDCPINVLFQRPEEYKCSVGGSETMEELLGRTGEFIDEIAMPLVNGGKDVLIVGHGAMNCSIITNIRKLPVSEFWSAGIEQCRIMKLL